MKYVGSTNTKEFLKDLKPIYTAVSEEKAKEELGNLKNKWGAKYPIVIRSWENNWDNLITFFQYSGPIRKLIYTTNVIEGFNRQLRKVTKTRGVFPNSDSLFKLLYLAAMDNAETRMGRNNWAISDSF